jgi:phosphate transport system permease protein
MSMVSQSPLRGHVSKARKVKNKLFAGLCFFSILFAGLILVVLLGTIIMDGAPRLSGDFFTSFTSRFPKQAGIKAALFGTLWVVTLSALISVPIGIAAALYLEELTPRKNKFTDFIQVNIANLAGVPSIVYGLLGLALFVRWLAFDRSILSGALTMALLILPMIILVSQEALKAVPQSFRDGSLALGATRWQTVRRQVLPAAMPGILTGVILSVSRAMGETAPLITIGAATTWFIPTKPTDSFNVLPIQIFDWSSRAQKGFHDNAAAAILVLLMVLLTLNSVAIFLRARAQKRSSA